MQHAFPVNKKKLIILCCSVLSACAAILLAFLIIKGIQKSVETGSPLLSSLSSELESTPSDVSSSEPTESVSTPVDNGIRLVLSSPSKTNFTTTEPNFVLSGTSDPAQPLTLNGNEVQRDGSGNFAMNLTLNVGKNVFTLLHKGESKVCNVTYRYVVINGYAPSTNQIYSSGSTFTVAIAARAGSNASATFNGTTIKLNENVNNVVGENTGHDNTVFHEFMGSFTLPSGNLKDLALGKVKFSATFNGVTETFYSGNITCKKPNIVVDYDPNATPAGGRYINVGSGKIAEILIPTAETFDAYSTNDWSRPTNNYLPAGTVDYSAQGYVYYKTSKEVSQEYAILRYGRQVYTTIEDKPGNITIPAIREYAGTLPDHNEIGIAAIEQSQKDTVLTFNCLWKAPFYFDLLPQQYTNPSKQDYTITNATYNYIDITFCYATVFTGEIAIAEDNPLFSSGKIIQNQSDYTLRLYLKKQGAFYGWDSYYNESNQLCFRFLHPTKITSAANAYNADLTGAKILIDVGHNGPGIDPGASGLNPNVYPESNRNLNLALKLKAELESIGATVIMTRYDNSNPITYQQRIAMLRREKPDYCIAIHHDSASSSTASGFGSFYSTPFSKNAAEFIRMQTSNAGIYNNINPLRWHYFFLARTTACPVVLTENGFMSNVGDFAGITNEDTNQRKAKALARGVVDYFKSIQ